MKKTNLLVLLLSGLLLFSCGKSKEEKAEEQSKPKEESTFEKVGKALNKAKSAKSIANDMEDLQENVEKLKEMEPISNADLKDFFPDKLIGLDRKSFSVSDSQSFINLTQGEATYSDEDHKIKITVTDGAGEGGAAIVPTAMIVLRRNTESETEKGFSKTTEKDGHAMKIDQNKNRDRTDSSMEFEVDNRFIVKLEGQNYTADELEEAYKDLEYDKLK